jgi:hypothetical protein
VHFLIFLGAIKKPYMADLVAETILDGVIKISFNLIKETYSSICGVKEDVKNLARKLTAIKAVLVDAEKKQVNNQQLKDWLGKLKEADFDAEDLLETFAAEAYQWQKRQTTVRNCLPYFGKASSQYDTAHKIKDISKRFDIIAEEKNKFHLNIQVNGGRMNTEIPNYTGFFVDKSEVVGREVDKEKIIHMMLSNEFDKEGDIFVLPIIGMGGLGKTTLAQLVFNDESVSSHFESRMWICVTVEFGLMRILKEMIQFLSPMKLDDSSTSYLQSRLLEFLRGKTFLLVLDDVWTEDISKWDSLRVLLKQGAKGSRVLVTSRISRVGEIIGTQPSYRLAYLPEDECWSLFAKIAFGNIRTTLANETRKELEDIGREIVRKCEGLPLAVKAMGGLLRGHIDDVSKWQQIQSSAIWEIEYQDPEVDNLKVMAILKLSYDHLPFDLKRCLEYCSLFPKSHLFYKEELVKLWIAQGFIQSTGRDTMEEVGNAKFCELVIRTFFQQILVPNNLLFQLLNTPTANMRKFLCNEFIQKGTTQKLLEHDSIKLRSLGITVDDFPQYISFDYTEIYIMHDLIHDLAQSVASPNCCQVKENELCNFSEQSRHVSLLGKDVQELVSEIVNRATKLRSLLLPESIEANLSGHLKNFGQAFQRVFHSLKCMRALDLSSSLILELPESIEELKLLRYLDLSRTEIKVLPNSICNLFNLQTLKLLQCVWLFSLPKDLGNLVNLRHLELDDIFWFKLSMLPPSMGNLTGLHNLHVFQVGREKGYEIEQLEKMAHLSGTLHISKLEEAASAGAAKLNEKKSLHKLVFEWSTDVVVNTQDEATENSVLKDLQPHSNLKELQIIRYRGNEFPAWMKEGRLRHLVSLTLNGCLKCKTLDLGDQLPNLRELCIKGMQELEKWTDVECRSLYRLIFSNCPKLRDLPSIFPNLNKLKIKSCNSLRALPVVPSLQLLKLINNLILEDLNEKVLEQVEAVNDQYQRETMRDRPSFSRLATLRVKSCPKLQALPRLFSPQRLEISRCELLTTLPPPPHNRCIFQLTLEGCDDGALVGAIPEISSLESLVISSISNISSLPKWPQLPGLKALYIRDCKDLVSLSNGEEGSLRTLASLYLLSIRNCEKLETLNDQELPTSLECLIIASCPLLKSFSLKNIPSLSDLYIEDCPMLQSLPGDGLPSSLKHLQIQTCPLLSERCQKEGGGGPDWPKIEHIPDLEIDNSHILVPSTSVANRPVWYRHFICCRGYYFLLLLITGTFTIHANLLYIKSHRNISNNLYLMLSLSNFF